MQCLYAAQHVSFSFWHGYVEMDHAHPYDGWDICMREWRDKQPCTSNDPNICESCMRQIEIEVYGPNGEYL